MSGSLKEPIVIIRKLAPRKGMASILLRKLSARQRNEGGPGQRRSNPSNRAMQRYKKKPNSFVPSMVTFAPLGVATVAFGIDAAFSYYHYV